jgi:hypothetical protein|tara:strand:+ start:3016 stop:3348 length:333 start_codon:yes stop_codon:yes gene_type:complete
MGIITPSFVSSNLKFAIANVSTTLTSVTPTTNTEIYSANKQDIEIAFAIFEDGRETSIDTKFFIDIDSYTTLPTKGHILTDGSRNYKVIGTHRDSLNVTLRLDCQAEAQR